MCVLVYVCVYCQGRLRAEQQKEIIRYGSDQNIKKNETRISSTFPEARLPSEFAERAAERAERAQRVQRSEAPWRGVVAAVVAAVVGAAWAEAIGAIGAKGTAVRVSSWLTSRGRPKQIIQAKRARGGPGLCRGGGGQAEDGRLADTQSAEQGARRLGTPAVAAAAPAPTAPRAAPDVAPTAGRPGGHAARGRGQRVRRAGARRELVAEGGTARWVNAACNRQPRVSPWSAQRGLKTPSETLYYCLPAPRPT